MLFKEIIGQHEVKQHLLNTVKQGRVAHAQLFLGPEGSGNLALAMAYAQYINCTNQQEGDSCGTCPSCAKYNKLIHPDLHFTYPVISGIKQCKEVIEEWRKAFLENPYLEIFDWLQALNAENKQGNITAEECRDIISRLALKPFESDHKVLVMWMPEYLRETGNSLLKIIEEPPHKTLFLLVACNADHILPTITSRTQLVKIPALSETEIANVLVQQHEVDPTQASGIAFLSGGNYNKALQIATHHEHSFFEAFRIWMLNCYQNRMPDVINWVEDMAGSGREMLKLFLQYGLYILQECLHIRYQGESQAKLQEAELEFARKFANFLTVNNIYPICEEINQSIYHIERNANAKIVLIHLSLQVKHWIRPRN